MPLEHTVRKRKTIGKNNVDGDNYGVEFSNISPRFGTALSVKWLMTLTTQ